MSYASDAYEAENRCDHPTRLVTVEHATTVLRAPASAGISAKIIIQSFNWQHKFSKCIPATENWRITVQREGTAGVNEE